MSHRSAATPHVDTSHVEKDHPLSTRLEHLTRHDLLLVRSYEPDFMAEVDRAFLAKRPVYLELNGYKNNRDIIAACLWYALDHGLKIVVTSSSAKPSTVKNAPPKVEDMGSSSSTEE